MKRSGTTRRKWDGAWELKYINCGVTGFRWSSFSITTRVQCNS
ncbi:hypothetical protein A2U01_0100156, partial [Trifolium medium]|nr:hypothetical protein [Trifolium medium]